MYFDFVQPFVLPPYWKNHPVPVQSSRLEAELSDDEYEALRRAREAAIGQRFQCPVRFQWPSEGEPWTFPLDPVVSISGGNNIIKTNVLKQDNRSYERRGTIKEVWSQNDYDIQIAGILIGNNGDFPADDIMKLRAYCEGREIIDVDCDLLNFFGVTRIAIESFDFPHTPGRENQQFSIKAISDDDFDLLIKQ